MHSGLFIKVLLGCFLLLGNAPEKIAAIAATASATEHPEEASEKSSNGGTSRSKRDGRSSSEDTSNDCITSADCAFNGECIKDPAVISSHNGSGSSNMHKEKKIDPEAPGRCECFAGWKGSTCEILDLLPVDPERVGLVLPNHDSSTWGGSVVYHDGLYHMFASEILYNCGLYSWTTNSQVIRATSESPFGPYKKVQVILPPFAHDTNIVRAPTGEFVLYVTALKGVKPRDCRDPLRNHIMGDSIQRRRNLRNKEDSFDERHGSGFRRSDDDDNVEEEDEVPPKDTYMLWANEPEGPWSEPIMVLNSTIYNSDFWKKYNKTAKCDSNLNGIILPSKDGETKQSFLGLWRRCETEDLLTIPHALVASDWKNASTYQPIVDHPLFVLAGSGAEDPSNIWTTRTSDMAPNQFAYHAIFHDEQATRCMLGSCGGQGRHAVSLDGTTWRYATVNAYERHVSWNVSSYTTSNKNHTLGSEETRHKIVRADTRARPHIVLAPGGPESDPLQQTPIALSTGLKETDESGYVYTLVQPLRASNGKAAGGEV